MDFVEIYNIECDGGGRKYLLVGIRCGNDVSVDGFIASTPVYSQINEASPSD